MDELHLELPGGDIDALLEHVERAAFINVWPGVDARDVPPRSGLAHLIGNRGPTVPLATWTPGEIGLQHMAGQRVRDYLAERGVAIPDDWYIAADHPKRGLVVKTYATPVADVLRWLVRAATVTCPLEITGPWQATVHTR
ncbi:MAG TPA: hypothetical protein VIR58_10520 [Acidimicrobiales bacterium]